MNLNLTKQEIAIAKRQAQISAEKSMFYKAEGCDYKSLLYSVRAKALNAYVDKLIAKIANHKKRQYKKANS